MSPDMADCFRNINEPALAVRHADLERYSDESVYKINGWTRTVYGIAKKIED